MSKRTSYDKVVEFFKDNNVNLLTTAEEYYNDGVIEYPTKCGHGNYKFNRSLSYLIKHKSNLYCKKCRGAYACNARFTESNIEKEMKKENCVLIEYYNTKQSMKYIASCGHETSIAPRNWRSGGGRICKKCTIIGIGLKRRKSKYNYITNKLKNLGCDVLNISKADRIIVYKALCGHINTISYYNFSGRIDDTLKICYNCYKKIAIEKRIDTMVKRGKCIDPSKRTELDKYYKCVWLQTENNYKKYYTFINSDNIKRQNNKFCLDHIYSIQQGFINKIAPEIISHPCNLRILSWVENSSKNNKCDITIDELKYSITGFINVS